jgi:hypothetical protein
LAIYRYGNLSLLEAFDTWLCPDLAFDVFCQRVSGVNAGLRLRENEEFVYTTQSGTRVHAHIWTTLISHPDSRYGAEVLKVEYGQSDMGECRRLYSWDAIGDAGNISDRFLNGTVLNSPREAVVEITNPALGTKLTLDMSLPGHPRRTSESGIVEDAGNNHEVWVDFDWLGSSAGDVCQPFKSLAAASDAVADGGVVRVVPGTTLERATLGATKRFTLVAPIGGVIIGAGDSAERTAASGSRIGIDNVGKDDIWVQFDFPDSNMSNAPGRLPLNTLAKAVNAVPDGGIIRIVPGATGERSPIGVGKRFTLSAPIGGVILGAT